MTTEQLVEAFKESFLKTANETNIYQQDMDEVMYDVVGGEMNEGTPEFAFEQDNTQNISDSYGYTDDELSIIFKHKETGRFVEIYGTRKSYQGTEVDGVKEVFPEVQQVTIFK